MSIASVIQRLQSAKTAIASAITAKGGTVSASDGLEDFSADIATIPSTSSIIDITFARHAWAMFHSADFSDYGDKLEINWDGCPSDVVTGGNYQPYFDASTMFFRAKLPQEVVIHGNADFRNQGTLANAGTFLGAFRYATGIKTLRMPDQDFKTILNGYDMFRYCSLLETIDANFALVWSNTTDTFGSCSGLKNITFEQNATLYGFSINSSSLLTDASIISIANGLKEGLSTAQTLTLHATPKARCSTIVGTVVLDSTGTYHIFTEDASGSVTLTDFITSTKGWTLA